MPKRFFHSFDKAVRDMTGNPCPLYFKICIKYISPALMVVLLVWLLVESFMTEPLYTAFVNCNPVSSKFWLFSAPHNSQAYNSNLKHVTVSFIFPKR